MIVLQVIIVVFLLYQLLVSIINLFLIDNLSDLEYDKDKVSIIIPARNEEKNIETILIDVFKQSHQNIEVIVLNDSSTDRTYEIVRRLQFIYPKLILNNMEESLDGWKGKVKACYQASKLASGDFLLFLDADIRIDKNLVTRSLIYMKKNKLTLFSIFPKQLYKSFGETVVVRMLNQVLLGLLPLVLVKSSGFSSFAAANGQFMMFRRKEYLQLNPHLKFKYSNVEDIDIATYYKKKKLQIATIYSHWVTCRMYRSYSEALLGFAKNIRAIFKKSLLFFSLYMLANFFFLALFVYIELWVYFICIGLIILRQIILSIKLKESILENLVCFIPYHFNLIIVYIKSYTKLTWKGRNI